VYVEFLVVFLPLFLLFLGGVQAAFLYASQLGVRHAAATAARSAAVVLDDDPRRYDGAPRLSVTGDGGCGSSGARRLLSGVAKGVGMPQVGPGEGERCTGGPRVTAVQTSAIARMIPFSPSFQYLAVGATGSGPLPLIGKSLYSLAATVVSFPNSDGTGERETLSADDRPAVRVTYLHHCLVPIASLFACDRLPSLYTGFDTEMFKRGDWERRAAAQRRLKRSNPGFETLLRRSSSPGLLFALVASSSRFAIQSADASLPIQGAAYPYQSELE